MQTPSPHPATPKPLTHRLPRLSGWLLITLLLLAAVLATAPQQIPVSLYKLSLVTLAGVVGYWLDRSLFPYARPDAFLVFQGTQTETFTTSETGEPTAELTVDYDHSMALIIASAMLRRAVIVAATMVAMGLGA